MSVALCTFLCFYFNVINALSMLSCLSDVNSIDVMFGEFNCLLRVFDPGRLLVVRVGNLNELTDKLRVFDPGRLFVVRVGNFKRVNQQVKGVRPRPLTCGKGGKLK